MDVEYLRSFRLGGYAIFDMLSAFLGIYLLSPWLTRVFLKIGLVVPKKNWLILTLPLGVLFHLLFGAKTLMTERLFDPSGYYFLKIFLVCLFVFGLVGVKKK